MQKETRCFVALLMLSALAFGLNAGGYDLWPPDEPRYAEVAREMVTSGDYLVPRVNGEVYTEKPPLLFWSMAAFGHLLGADSAWAARLPSIVAGIYVVGMVFLLGRRMFSFEVGLWAALILITAFRFWYQARRGQIDVVLTAAMLTALYAFWRWDSERRAHWLVVAYAAMGAGLLAKGPPALVFPLLFLITFYWKNTPARKSTHWVLGSLAAIGMVLLWYVPARMAGADTATEAVQAGIGDNLFRNTLGRFLLGVSKAQPPWYYLGTLPVDLLPWTFVAPPILMWAWRVRKTSQAHWALFSWIVPAFIFFSISIGKRELYLLPLLPVFAILFGAGILHLRETGNLTWLRRGGIAWSIVLLVLAAAPAGLGFSPYPLQEPVRIYLLAAVAGVAGISGLAAIRLAGGRGVPVVLVVQTLAVYCAATLTVFPEVNHFKSARPICEPVRQLMESGADFHLYSVGFSREEYVFYAGRFHEPVFTGLVGEVDPDSLLEQARLQKEARKVISRAVEDIPVKNLAAIQPEERAALLEAIDSAVNAHEDAAAILAFEEELKAEITRFFHRFAGETAALAFVQEEDWRWLVPLHDGEVPVEILVDRSVGSRHVLLLANGAGQRLLGSVAGTVSEVGGV